ncbi:hypothetical protein [Kitasatospora sp. NPDC097643]|uniref:hypothetical protein n=1 Tax=Kitasatospora sp. NPDC097643 TaxID=3157230 RepID=UPI00331F091A
MTTTAPFTPTPGSLVHDSRTKQSGILMDVIAGLFYLRPPGGGIEWTARPEDVNPPPPQAS